MKMILSTLNFKPYFFLVLLATISFCATANNGNRPYPLKNSFKEKEYKKAYFNLTTGRSTTITTGTNYGLASLVTTGLNNSTILVESDFSSAIRAKTINSAGVLTTTSVFPASVTGSLVASMSSNNNNFSSIMLNNGNLFLLNWSEGNNGLSPVKFFILNISASTATLVTSGTINSSNPGPSPNLNRQVAAAKLSNGNVAIVWQRSDNLSTALRIFDQSGNAVTSETIILQGTASSSTNIRSPYYNKLTASPAGGFLYTCEEGNNSKIAKAMLFNNAGTLQQIGGANIYTIDPTPATNSAFPVIPIGLLNGNFAIVYSIDNLSCKYQVINSTGVVKTSTTAFSNPSGVGIIAAAINTPGNEGFVIGNTAAGTCSLGLDLYRYNMVGVSAETTSSAVTCSSININDGPNYNIVSGSASGINIINYNSTAASSYNTSDVSSLSYEMYQVPIPITGSSSVSGTSVTLNGTMDANGANTTATFEYTTDPSFSTGVTSAAATPSSVTSAAGVNTAITVSLTGLTASTTYYYRAKGVNTNGSAAGLISSFTTGVGGAAGVTVTVTNPTNAIPNLQGTYSSLAAAINDLNLVNTINGPITLTCAAGSETAPVGGYSIRFPATTTATNNVVITGTATTTITANTGLTAGNLNDAIFKIIGSDYVTIQNFTMQENSANTITDAATNNMTEWGVALLYTSSTNGAQNNTIQNNTISLNRSYSNTFGIYSNVRHSATDVITTADISAVSGSNSGNKVYNNTISNVDWGIVFIGTPVATAGVVPMDNGNDIGGASLSTGNTITNWGGLVSGAISAYVSLPTTNNSCIYMNHQIGDNVSFNTITSATNITTLTTTAFLGILKTFSVGQPTIGTTFTSNYNNNTVTLTNAATTSQMTGMSLINLTTLSTATFNCNNNNIINLAITGSSATTASISGITHTSAPGTSNINNNTIRGFTTTVTGAASCIGIQQTTNGVVNVLNINNNKLGDATAGFVTFTGTSNSSTVSGIFVNSSGAASTCAVSISNNDIRGIVQNNLGTGTHNYLSCAANAASLTINANTFTNISANTTGTTSFIVISSSTSTLIKTVTNNSIVTGFSRTGTSGSAVLISDNGSSATGAVTTIQNNNFSNISLASTSSITGIFLTDGLPSSTKNITGNILNNWTAITGNITAVNINSWNGVSSLSNNIITNLTGQNTITGISMAANVNNATSLTVSGNTINNLSATGSGSAAIVTGITCSNTSTLINFTGNTINTLSSTGAASVTGIIISGATTTNVVKNKIYDLSGSNASSTVSGITVSGGAIVNVYNNLVGDLRTPAANAVNPLIGLNITGGSIVNAYYNTIYLNGSSTGTLFGSSAVSVSTTPIVTFKNNIFYNNSTVTGAGLAAAYRRSSSTLTTYGSNSNNNDFFASTIFTDGTNTDATIAAYKARVSSIDAASFYEDPEFQSVAGANANFLKFKVSAAKQIESGGANIATYTDDYFGTTRQGNAGYAGTGTAPDLGAWELQGIALDITAPTISYTPLTNSLVGVNQTLTATITDPSGVPTTGVGLPKLYWKLNSGSYNAITATSLGNNQYSFTFGSATITVGDVISYYIVAQDMAATPNVGAIPNIGASGLSINPPAVSTPTSAPSTFTALAALSGTKTVCTSGCDYTSLTGVTGAFNAINTSLVTGNLILSVASDLVETGAVALNQFATGYKVQIRPNSTTIRKIEGTTVTTLAPMIDLNGADNVSINGAAITTGTGRYLRFINNAATANNTGPVFRLYNDARVDSIQNCIIESNANNGPISSILLGTTVNPNGNDSIVVNSCLFQASAGTNPGSYNIAYSSSGSGTGTQSNSDNIITNCTFTGLASTSPSVISINGLGNGNNWTISNNIIYNNVNFTVTHNAIYIANSVLTNNVKISGNSIGGSAADRSGNFYGTSNNNNLTAIYLSLGTTIASTVDGNIISNFGSQGIGSGSSSFCIQVISGKVNIGSISGNTLGGGANVWDTLRTGYDNGWITINSPDSVKIENNTIGNFAYYGGSNDRNSAITIVNGVNIVRNNTIRDGKSNSTATSNSQFGLKGIISTSALGQIIEGNTIYNLQNTNTGTNAYPTSAIQINGFGSNTTISRNRIYNISSLGIGAPLNIGIYNGNSANLTISNNQISLSSSSTLLSPSLKGIYSFNGGSNKLFYNSIYIGGTCANAASTSHAYLRGGNSTDSLRNNLFFNDRTGGLANFAIGTSITTGWTSSFSDYNLFIVPDLTKTNEWVTNTNNTLAQWTTNSGGDVNSIVRLNTTTPASSFFTGLNASPVNLSIQTGSRNIVKDLGTPVPSVTIDYDLNPRPASINSIGAFEYSIGQIANNIITNNQTICSGSSPSALSGTLPTGGLTFTYTWLKSTTNATTGFTVASGTNNTQNYTPGALTQSTWFRRLVVTGTLRDTSAAVAITVNPVIAGNTVGSNQNIVYGATPVALTGALPTGGSGTYSYSWLNSTNNSTSGFIVATGTNNSQNYTPAALTQNTWYRRLVTSGTCSDTSIAVAITIPAISTTGTLSALNTNSGTASANTSFIISGTNMSAGILVTPPAGFEVSNSATGPFTATITVGSAGTIANTTVYIRLAAATAAGNYSGNIVLSSAGATNVNVPTVSSTVTAVPLITSSNNFSSFNACAGIASTEQLFTVRGQFLTADLVVTAPTGFEISRSTTGGVSTGSYSNSITLTRTVDNVSSTTLFIRLSSTAASSNTGGNIVCTTTGGTTVNIPMVASISLSPAAPSISSTSALSVCAGASVPLTSTLSVPANTLAWFRNGVSINNTTAGYSASLAGSYTTVETSLNGCASAPSAAAIVVVNNVPTATISQGSQLAFTNCSTTSLTLNANTGEGLSYQWRLNGSDISNANSSSYGVTQAGNYTVRVRNASNCSVESAATNVLSVPSASASGSTNVCAGNTVSLTANATGFTSPTYQWLRDGAVINNATAAGFGAMQTGSYSVRITSGSLIATSCPISVTVNALPSVSISPSPSNSVCVGSPLTINTTAATATAYQWLNGTTPITNATAISYAVTESGSYSVRVTDANGCINTSAASTVAVNALPVVAAISGASQVNVGSNITLINTTSGGTWSSNNTSTATINATNGSLNGLSAGNVQVRYTVQNANGCSSFVTTNITVNALAPKPTISTTTPTSFCAGGSVVLGSSATTLNQWYKDGVAIGGANAATYTATQTGVYTVAAGVNPILSDGIQVTSNALPTATITQGAQLAFTDCSTTSINLSANSISGATYQWINASGNILNATNQQYTVTQAGNYSVRVTDVNGCISTSSATRVAALPTASVTGNTVVCAGTPVALSIDPSLYTAPTFQWKNGGVNVTNETNANFNPSVSGTYTIDVTDNAITSTSCPISITVNPLPTGSIAASPTASVCAGTTVILNATPNNASAYQWFNTGNAITNATNNNFIANASGNYSVRITDANGCFNTIGSSNVVVNPLPVVGAISGSQTICANTNTNYTNQTTGGVWTSSNTDAATVDQFGSVRGVGAGTSTITYTVTNNGCSTPVTRNITVTAAVAITTQPTATINQCVGTSATISVVATGANLTYQWFKNGIAIDGATTSSYTDNSLISTDAGNYTVVVSSACGNITSSASVWTVNAPPDATISQGFGVALGANGSVTLTANTGTGFQYRWLLGGNTITNQTASTLNVTQTGSYTVQVTSAAGCVSSISSPTVVTTLPTATAGGATTFCDGGNVNISVTLAQGQTFVRWKDANGLTVGTNNTTYNATTTGSYSAEINTGGSNVQSTQAVQVTVNALPTATITSNVNPAEVCAGNTVLLTGAGGTSYQWLQDNSAINNATNATYTASATGSYQVRATDVNGCRATSTATRVTINPLPTASINASGNTSFCAGGSVVLTSASATGNQWFKDGVLINGAINNTFTATTSGSYTVRVSSSAGCSATSTATIVTVNPIPTATITNGTSLVIGNASSINLSANTGTGLTYVWFLNGTAINGQTSATLNVVQTGSYTVQVSNATGCSALSTPTVVSSLPTLTTGGSTSFCPGGSVLITATIGNGQTFVRWKDANGVTVGTNATTYTATTSGSYSAEINTGTSVETTQSVAVNVYTLPTITINSSVTPATVCAGNNILLTATGGTSYQWLQDGNVLSGSTASTYTANLSGAYSVRNTDANGCIATANATNVTINALPVVAAITGTQQVCVGSTTTFTSTTTGGVWSSGTTGVATISPTGVITGVSAGTATISYSVTNTNGCSTIVTRDVTVNALPTVAAITGTQQVCVGSTTAFTSTTTGGVWSSGTTSVATISATGVITGVSAGTATISYTVTNTSGCITIVTRTVTVNAPVTNNIITASQSICTGTTPAQLTGSTPTGGVGNNYTYAWQRSTTSATAGFTDALNPINNTINYQPTALTQTTWFRRVVSSGVCASDNSAAVMITVNPTVAITTQPTATINQCVGTSATISVVATGANLTYQWFKNGIAIDGATTSSYTDNSLISTDAGNYTVVVSSACGNITSSASVWTVNALPDATISQGFGVALGSTGSVTLSANTGTGFQYRWLLGGNTIANQTASTLNVTQTGSYTVQVTNAAGCASSISSPTVVTTLPTATAGGATTFCDGGNVNISVTVAQGQTFVRWKNANGVTVGTNSTTYNATTSGSYSAEINTGGSNVQSTQAVQVTVNALPTASITSSVNPAEVCAGNTVLLTGAGGTSYQWLQDNSAINNATGTTYTASTAGSYQVRATDVNGCRATSAATTVTINPLPTASINASGNTSFCTGSSVVLTSAAATGNQWFKDGVLINGAINNTFTATTSGSYTVRVSSGAGCSATSTATVVTVNPIPTATITNGASLVIGNASSITLSANTGTGLTYAWFLNGTAINGQTSSTLNVVQTGSYTVQVSNASGCSALSTPTVVSSLPTLTAGGATSICPGGSVLISATIGNGQTFVRWKNANGVTVGTNATTYTATTSGSYSAEINTGTSVETTQSVAVNVFTLPTITINSSVTPATVCAGNNILLTATGGTSYQWLQDGNVLSGSTASTYTANLSGAYSVRNTDANGCIATANATNVTINALPVVAAITGTQQVCVGSTTTFTSTTTGGVWSSGTTGVATISPTGVITGVSAGTSTISYTVTNTNGCSTIVTRDVTVNALPTVAAITGTQQVCVGSTTAFTSTTTGGVWSSGTTSVATISATGVITGVSAGTATISYTVTNTSGCITIVTRTVTVNALPIVAAITGNQQVCVGSTTAFTSSTTGGVWNSGTTAVATISATGVITGVSAGTSTISYTVTNTNGCSTIITRDVTVNALPTVAAITGTQQVCVGSTTAFTSTTTGGVWSSGNTTTATIDANGLITGRQAGTATISYTVTNASGCITIVSRDVTVNALPTVAAISGANQVCFASTTPFTNVTTGGVWSSGNTTAATVDANGVITGRQAGTATISYTVTNTSGCVTLVTKDILVNALPLITATASPALVNKGQTTQLNVSAVGNIASFVWSPTGGTFTTNPATTTVTVNQNTTYTVTATSTAGCVNTANVAVTTKDEVYVETVNVFTPNGDGINDKFVIKNLNLYPNNKLQVFDRTGKILYEKDNYANDWDGYVNGKLLTKDTYFYILTVNGQIVKRATITIIR